MEAAVDSLKQMAFVGVVTSRVATVATTSDNELRQAGAYLRGNSR